MSGSKGDMQNILEKMQEALLEADVPYHVAYEFCQTVRQDIVAKQDQQKHLKADERFLAVVHERSLRPERRCSIRRPRSRQPSRLGTPSPRARASPTSSA